MSEKKGAPTIFNWVKQVLFILVLTLFISTVIIQTYNINDVSMEPTFDRQGNRVLVFLTPYLFNAKPGYGDIIILDSRVERSRTAWDRLVDSPLINLFTGSHNESLWVKRVVGLPGDRLEYREGAVYRNGLKLSEDYVMEKMSSPFAPVEVPAGHVFVMGDNRNSSSDSRNIGPVPLENIQGRVILRFLPPGKFSLY